jgi:hypothetical protein
LLTVTGVLAPLFAFKNLLINFCFLEMYTYKYLEKIVRKEIRRKNVHNELGLMPIS